MKKNAKDITEERLREIQLETAHGLIEANLRLLKGNRSKEGQDYRKLCNELLEGDFKGLDTETFCKYIRNVYELSNAIKEHNLKGSDNES